MTTTVTAPREFGMAALQARGAELALRDRWSRARLLEFQAGEVRSLLAHAAQASPYYREVIGSRAADRALAELPTLPKATLMDQFDRIVTDPALRLCEVDAHAASARAALPFRDKYRVFSTSGTAGLRGLIVYTEAEFREWTATSLRLFARIGITRETRLVPIGAPNPLHITNQLFAAFRAGRSGAPRLSVMTPLDEMVAALNEYRPEAIIGYTSVAALLAQEQLEGRLRVAPHIVGVGSEVLTDETRQRLRDAWNVTPAEVYAATEALYIATSIPPHPGLHIYEDMLVVEVVDEHDRPVPPGAPGFKVLVTNLVNRAQPLIRYEISDSVVLADGPETRGLPYRQIASIDGRSDDILKFRARGGGEVAVHPYRLRAPFSSLAEVRQYQIVHDERGVEVRIVLGPGASPETPARVRAAVVAGLEAAGAVPPPVEVVTVALIEREGGHAAKVKLVKSRTNESSMSAC